MSTTPSVHGGGSGKKQGGSLLMSRRLLLLAPQAFLCLPSSFNGHRLLRSPSSPSFSSHLSGRGSSSRAITATSYSSSASSIPEEPKLSAAVKLPKAVSPSSLGDFKTCPRLYRFRHIERVPEAASEVMVRGSMVHDALEKLYEEPPSNRTVHVLHDIFRAVWLKKKEKYTEELFPTVDRQRSFGQAGLKLLSNYYKVEDPQKLEPSLREFRMRVSLPGGLNVTGVLDRVDEDQEGELMVIDYKTGKAPVLKYSQPVNDRIINDKFFQLKIYALLLGETKHRTPKKLKLIYLDGPSYIDMTLKPGDLEAAREELTSLWEQILSAANYDEFPTKPGRLCEWCSFKSICPAWSFPAQLNEADEGGANAASAADAVTPCSSSESVVMSSGREGNSRIRTGRGSTSSTNTVGMSSGREEGSRGSSGSSNNRIEGSSIGSRRKSGVKEEIGQHKTTINAETGGGGGLIGDGENSSSRSSML